MSNNSEDLETLDDGVLETLEDGKDSEENLSAPEETVGQSITPGRPNNLSSPMQSPILNNSQLNKRLAGIRRKRGVSSGEKSPFLHAGNSLTEQDNNDQNTSDVGTNNQGKSTKIIKDEAKAKVKVKITTFLLTHWWIILIAVILLLLFIIIFVVITSLVYESDSYYLDYEYDFTATVVTLTSNYNNESDKITLQTLSFEDFVEGFIYAELYDNLDGKTDEELENIFKTYLLIARSLALSIGKYDNETKEITIQSGANGMPYCDPFDGCKIVDINGSITYVSSLYNKPLGTVIKEVPALDAHILSILTQAYSDTKYLLLSPKTLDEAITTFEYNIPYTQTIKTEILQYANKDYEKIIDKINSYDNYKIYNLENYATKYIYSSVNNTAYWWPIGSNSPTSGNIYGGTPSTVAYDNPDFGWRLHPVWKTMKYHQGEDIAGGSCDAVIIATRAGTVTDVVSSCTVGNLYCGSGWGNHVTIDHGDGTTTNYAHMKTDSPTVKVGDTVAQGEKIGLVGTTGTSTGCHLHFEIKINGSFVNPLDYIDSNNPRPVALSSGYAEGNSNAQTVCLSLKETGFSNNAVAAIMTNMQAESNFSPTVIGDNGTSIGLCQWHAGRYSALKNYCGSNYTTVQCQLRYLIYELQNSYRSVYNYLQSNSTAYNMANYYCVHFEVPANTSYTCAKRASDYTARYASYVNNNCS